MNLLELPLDILRIIFKEPRIFILGLQLNKELNKKLYSSVINILGTIEISKNEILYALDDIKYVNLIDLEFGRILSFYDSTVCTVYMDRQEKILDEVSSPCSKDYKIKLILHLGKEYDTLSLNLIYKILSNRITYNNYAEEYTYNYFKNLSSKLPLNLFYISLPYILDGFPINLKSVSLEWLENHLEVFMNDVYIAINRYKKWTRLNRQIFISKFRLKASQTTIGFNV